MGVQAARQSVDVGQRAPRLRAVCPPVDPPTVRLNGASPWYRTVRRSTTTSNAAVIGTACPRPTLAEAHAEIAPGFPYQRRAAHSTGKRAAIRITRPRGFHLAFLSDWHCDNQLVCRRSCSSEVRRPSHPCQAVRLRLLRSDRQGVYKLLRISTSGLVTKRAFTDTEFSRGASRHSRCHLKGLSDHSLGRSLLTSMLR